MLALALVATALISSACSISTTNTGTATSVDSSFFGSADRGDTWRSLTNVPTVTGRADSIAEVSVNNLIMDPEDSKALYLASYDYGLYYTYNIANGWNFVSGLPKATINDIQVDPKAKCILYAAVANIVYRSSDCSRTWTQVYYDNNAGVTVNTIAIDHYNSSNLYIGTSRGDIIKTIDSGGSWRTIQRLTDGVTRLIISPLDSRLVFVATATNKIYSFKSNTNTNPADSADLEANFLVDGWASLSDTLKDYDIGNSFKDIIVSKKDGKIFLATQKVILRSDDNGNSWESIKLIQSEKDAIINAIAVDPQDSNNLYYVTNTTFFRSSDAGATWTTKKLPTKRAGRRLLVDFNNPNVIYLGTKKIQ